MGMVKLNGHFDLFKYIILMDFIAVLALISALNKNLKPNIITLITPSSSKVVHKIKSDDGLFFYYFPDKLRM